eukprot:scaffold29303_cov17-Prasinocladus_malaysianus.AAC.1
MLYSYEYYSRKCATDRLGQYGYEYEFRTKAASGGWQHSYSYVQGYRRVSHAMYSYSYFFSLLFRVPYERVPVL